MYLIDSTSSLSVQKSGLKVYSHSTLRGGPGIGGSESGDFFRIINATFRGSRGRDYRYMVNLVPDLLTLVALKTGI